MKLREMASLIVFRRVPYTETSTDMATVKNSDSARTGPSDTDVFGAGGKASRFEVVIVFAGRIRLLEGWLVKCSS